MEIVFGTRRNDSVDGTDWNDLILTGRGDDAVDAGLGNDIVISGKGDDTVDGGAGSDWIKLGHGDDTGVYVASENSHASDIYDGGRGFDTLRIVLTAAEYARSDIQADLLCYLDVLDAGATNHYFVFHALSLYVRRFEQIEVVVDGVVVDPRADDPTVKADQVSTNEDSAAIFPSVLDNDDVPGLVASVALVAGPSKGALSFNPDGTFSFDPAGAFETLGVGDTETVSFTYEVTDYNGNTATASVEILVVGRNDAPIALAAATSALEDGPAITIGATASDIDATDTLTYSIDDTGTLGAVTNIGDGTFFYDPAGAFDALAQDATATDTFTYNIDDGNGGTATETVTVTLTGTNDGPTLTAGAGQATEDGPAVEVDLSLLGDDIDADDDGTTLTYTVTDTPAEGSAAINGTTLTFDPGSDFQDLAEGETRDVVIQVTATDAHGATAVNDVTVTVTGTNDAPIANDNQIGADITTLDTLTDATDFLESWGESGGGSQAGYYGQTFIAQGDLTDVSFAIDPRDSNADQSFEFRLLVTEIDSEQIRPTTVLFESSQITVTSPDRQVVTVDTGGLDLTPDTTYAIVLDAYAEFDGVLGNARVDAQIEGDPNGQFFFFDTSAGGTREEHFNSTWTVFNNTQQDLALDLTFVDAATDENTAFVIPAADLLSNVNDPDGDLISINAVSGISALGAVVTLNGDGSVSYDPTGSMTLDELAYSETATDTFIYTISDGNGGTSSATVTLTLAGTNDGPILAAGTGRAVEDGPAIEVDLSPLGNDIDADDDGTTLTYTVTDTPAEGSAAITGTTLTFDPGSDFQDLAEGETREVVIQVTATDAHGATAVNDVTISITGQNDAPVFTSGTTASPEENTTAAYTAVASDAEGDAISYSLSGEDAALFDIDANTGTVAFLSAPDFEAPGDAGADNVYDVVITATDGVQSTDQVVAITVTDVGGETADTLDLSGLTTDQGFIIQGDAAFDYAGWSVSSAGDVNSDGFDDLIVGAPRGDNGSTNAGEAYVVYGRATGATVDLSALSATQGFIIQGDAAFDYAGNSVSSAGDVNGDGFDDLIVGAPRGDNGGSRAGEAYVIYGGATGTDVDLTTLTAARGFIIQGDAPYDEAGYSVSSAGDVNGDGFDDLIVGAPRGDDGNNAAGEAYVIFGGAAGTNVDLNSLSVVQGFIIQGDAAFDYAGWSVSSAGDVNGDGFDDLIVGAFLGDGGGPNAGETYVVYGSAMVADVDLNSLTAAQGFIIQGDAPGDGSGRSVSSAGDVNGDGFDDLIIGAPNGDDGGNAAGETYVVYGSATGATIDLANLGAQGFIIQGDEANDRAGFSVSSAGDVNGDGFDDLIVGAPYGDDGGVDAGEANVIYGGATGADIDLTTLTATQGFIIQGDAPGDLAGFSVSSAGDVNGDGFDDLIVGARGGDDGGANAGEAYVVYGGATGTESTTPVTEAGTAAADNFTGNAGDDSFTGIAAGDVVRGGAGDDAVTVTALDFTDVDGGHGTDTFIFNGAGQTLDLTGPRTDVESFEVFDLTGSGDNTLTLDMLALLGLSDDTSGGITTVTVLGNAGDTVDMSGDPAIWAANGTRVENSVTFDVYDSGQAEMLVQEDVTFLF